MSKSISTLIVPFLSDKCTAQIKRAAKVIKTPGRKFRDLLTSSRALES